MKIKYSFFVLLAFIFLALPVTVFFWGFLKVIWAVIFTAATFAAGFFLYRDTLKADREITVRPVLFCTAVLCCMIWAFFSGIGEFTWTTGDHTVRAAVLNDLVEYDWPVFFDLSRQSNPAVREALGGETVAFAYYFTFWMIPSLIGKVFGITAGRAALVIWGGLGLMLVTTGLFFIQKKPSFSAIAVSFLFGGLDIIPDLYQQFFTDYGVAWEGWNDQLYIHGNYFQTMNVFHQCIAGWLVTVLLTGSVNRRNIGTCGALVFCYSPWATIGALPIAVYELLRKREGVSRKQDMLTYGNIVMPVCILMCFGTFFTANIGATGDKGFIWEFFSSPVRLLVAYVLYVLIEFGIWALLVYKDEKDSGLYWVSLITLLIFPVYKMTEANDLLMRGTMVPMFVFTIFMIRKTDKIVGRIREKKRVTDLYEIGFLGMFLLMAFIPVVLLLTMLGCTSDLWKGIDTSVRAKDEIVSFGDIRNEEFTEVTKRQFYVYDYDGSLFFKVFGKGRT